MVVDEAVAHTPSVCEKASARVTPAQVRRGSLERKQRALLGSLLYFPSSTATDSLDSSVVVVAV